MGRFGQQAGKLSDAGSVAFLFLGELFLIPHLLPIALALARSPSPPQITMFVITSIHEEIVREALERLDIAGVTIRRGYGYRHYPAGCRETPRLPHKLITLARNAFAIMRHDVAVVAERTSLWLPRVTRCATRFIYNEHGAGPHANFASPRNRFAARILMPGNGMTQACSGGGRHARIETVGYIKRDYISMLGGGRALPPPFSSNRPTILYTPHWLREKSSWWSAGEQVLEFFARSTDYNLILAPHIRLPTTDLAFERRVAPFRASPNIHIDASSFRLVDQSYIDAADIYLGDGSSQVLEFAERPRPVLFLNPEGIDWRADPRFSHWQMGDVVGGMADLAAALAAAPAAHAHYAPIQRAYVEQMMGSDDGRASERAAQVILDVLAEARDTVPATAPPLVAQPQQG